MHRIPEFIESLEKLKKLHESKNEDYASEDNPFQNFEFTAVILKYFEDSDDKVFVWPIANKLSRLANLLGNKATPNNESVLDSLDDIACYALLWKAHIMRRETTTGSSYTSDRILRAREAELLRGMTNTPSKEP